MPQPSFLMESVNKVLMKIFPHFLPHTPSLEYYRALPYCRATEKAGPFCAQLSHSTKYILMPEHFCLLYAVIRYY